MDHVEYACVFVRAAGERLLAAERLVLAFPALLNGALRECDLHYRATSRFLGVAIRFDPEELTPAVSDRVAFWAARAGGRASAIASRSPEELKKLRSHLELCELARKGITPAALFDATGRFFSDAGAPPGRRRSQADRPVLAMDLGGPGWEGARYTRAAKQLFIAAPMAPPVGDAVSLAIRLPSADRPSLATATVIDVRGPAAAGPGLPAGYTLRLETAPPALLEALDRVELDQPAVEFRSAPRFPVRAAVKVIAAPASGVAPAAAPAGDAASPCARIEYATEQELAADFLENLSQGGAFVRTPSPAVVGTALTLELKLPNGADLYAPALVAFVNQHGMGLRFILDDQAEAVLSAAMASISARPRRALVVDDDALMRQMIGDALVSRGFEVLSAGDAREGLRTLSEELLALDLLVTDIRMPGMDGEELVRLIRKTGGETELAIVAVTGRLEDGLEPKLEAAGADAVLDKALGPELIAQAADAVLERKRLVGEGA